MPRRKRLMLWTLSDGRQTPSILEAMADFRSDPDRVEATRKKMIDALYTPSPLMASVRVRPKQD